MKILVTGGAGYIGSVCVEQLLDIGHQVFVFDNLSEGHLEAADKRAELILGDLNEFETINSVMSRLRPEAIMHFAANALVGESMTNPSKYFNNNVKGGINLLDAMVGNNVHRLVFSSTCATFGLPLKTPIDESFEQKPVNPYGESKLIFERILDWYHKIHKLEFVVLRYFNAAGATEKFGENHRTETHLIPNILKVAMNKASEVQVFGTDYDTPDGTCIRDYIHILDIAKAHILALEAEKSSYYNLGTGRGFSVKEIISACEKITGKLVKTVEKPRRAGDPPVLVASSKKIHKELGWKPHYRDIESIIASAWQWSLTHPDGYKK